MNALSYLTGSSSPSSSLPSLPNTNATSIQEELKLGGNLPNVSEEHEGGELRIQKYGKEQRKSSLIWRIVFFLPLWLIVKPVSLVWFVLTFPLSLIEHTSLKSVIENDNQGDMSIAVSGGEPRAPGEPVDDDDMVGESMVLHEDSIKSSRPSTSRSSYTSTRLGKFLFPKKLIPQSILQTDRKKVLVLDLDETLIHSISRTTSSSNTSQGHMVEVTFSMSGVSTLYYVHKRPYCDLFLSRVSKWYDLVIFTASMKEYADPVIDWLEGGISAKFSQRKYRSDCILRDGIGYVKDLSIISKSLQDMIIVDNSPVSYAMNVDNAIQVEGWISDPTDTGLLNLLPLLEGLRFTTDTRNILSLKNGERAFI